MKGKAIRNMGRRVGHDLFDLRFGIASFLLYLFLTEIVFHHICPMVIVTGLPCPACGLSRAVRYLFVGDFRQSLASNPFAIFWLLLAAYFAYMRYFCGKKVRYLYEIMACLCLVMILYYAYRMITGFPSDPPYVYQKNNLISILIHSVLHSYSYSLI